MNSYLPHPDPPDPVFLPSERLFHRVKDEDVEGENVLPSAIRLPDCSVNREKYALSPEVALQGYEDEFSHVASMCAGDLPIPQTTEGSITWMFFVAHDPLVDNYSHTEVRLKKSDQSYDVKRSPRGAVRTTLKLLLAEKMTVIYP